jgi:uncharacterized protein YndB with AHSA1/START domain
VSTDRIEREINISAPIERVWAVLTESEQIGTWFGNGKPAEIDLKPGGIMVLDHAEHGTYPTTIVTVDPPKSFSYLWASGYPGVVANEDNSTLVEFTLEPTAHGTLLRMAESGFDSVVIPPERAEDAGFESHSKGWTGVIARLGELVEGKTLAPLV